jgi:two-component system response regulator PilR (NtrC family)
VIQEKSLRPVGQTAELPVDVRILSATHKDLRALVASGQFREDLYYRINVIELRVPPLRERGDDTLLLSRHILARLAAGMGLPPPELSAGARARLAGYRFPGNVRELENILERAIALSGDEIAAEDIHIHEVGAASAAIPVGAASAAIGRGIAPEAAPTTAPATAALGDRLELVERETIVKALAENRYNKTITAKKLGLTLRALRYRMQKLGID